MSKKEMSLNFALDLLYQEATSEEQKYSQKQKEKLFELVSPKRELDVYKWLGNIKYYLNGKVVARFWCDKVDEIRCSWGSNFIDWSKYPSDERYDYYIGNEMDSCDICRVACLKMKELDNYLKMKNGYAIHISKLEVFDKPKELREFRHTCKAKHRGYNCWQPCSKECKKCVCNQLDDEGYSQCFSRLTKAPQSWCYVEE